MMIDTNTWWWLVLIFVVQVVANILISHNVNKKLKERDAKQEEIEKARLEYEVIMLEVTDASAKLSYALAMAIKRGSPNGEVEAGIDAYQKAMTNKTQFLQTQALYRIAK